MRLRSRLSARPRGQVTRGTVVLALVSALVLAAGIWESRGAASPPTQRADSGVAAGPDVSYQQPTDLVVLGDSVASGTACGCRNFGELLARSLASSSGHRVNVTNAAQNGLTTAGLLGRLRSAALDGPLRRAGVVTITIGANDFEQSAEGDGSCGVSDSGCFDGQLAALSSTLRAVLTEVQHRTPATTQVLVTGYWNVFLDGEVGRARGQAYVQGTDALTRQANARIAAEAAAAGARYVDLYAAYEAHDLAGLTALLAPDGDHPSAAGHRLIAKELLQALSPLPAGA